MVGTTGTDTTIARPVVAAITAARRAGSLTCSSVSKHTVTSAALGVHFGSYRSAAWKEQGNAGSGMHARTRKSVVTGNRLLVCVDLVVRSSITTKNHT